ncbi:hypothetical protein GCM10007216_10420 [Thalassobacillus devorans]|uniref:Uncharacterized protein n=1 Tax=Thalassobacillus devorans TaxID=279813 RepID=A0ABQ1NNT7_9BACI|nr:hypothetical protein GCM10007216_10420 [Thalassobacillus devorans]
MIVKRGEIMQITDEAKTDIIQILEDNDAEGIRLFLAGIG